METPELDPFVVLVVLYGVYIALLFWQVDGVLIKSFLNFGGAYILLCLGNYGE